MIFVDDRSGSKDLIGPLTAAGVEAEITRLETGDVCFNGRGNNGVPVLIGIERKRLDSSDFIQSMRSGRLVGEQLPKMLGPDGAFEQAWLFVEGQWKTDKFGRLLIHRNREWKPPKGNMYTAEMEKHLLTLSVCGGLHVRFTDSRDDTVRCLVDLYHWWCDKDLDRHGSHLAVHRPLGFIKLSDFRETVSRFPGVGLATSLAVEKRFNHSLRQACNASVNDWAGIATKDKQGKERRLGLKTAERIVQWLEGNWP